MKRNVVIGLVTAAIIAVVGWTALRWSGELSSIPGPPSAGKPPAAASGAPAPAAPSFDIVRVNPQGGMVMAGRAAPGAEVTVLDGDRVVGKVTADANGEWVLMPTDPLPPGNHQFSLAARSPAEGSRSVSDGVVAMVVPERTQPDQGAVAVLLPRSGNGPAKPLQLPIHRKFALDVIEYNSAGQVQMLGRAEPNARIEVYLDDRLAGHGAADATGGWSIMVDNAVPVGHYRLRLEASSTNGQPAARLALTFDRIEPPEGFAAVDVQPGNTLWRIAQHSYGEGAHYAEIFQQNRTQIRDPNLIYPGQVFAVPASR